LGPRDFNRPVTATLAGAPAMPFATFGVAPQRDGVVLRPSAKHRRRGRHVDRFRYERDISRQDRAHALAAGVRTTWHRRTQV